MPETSVKTIVIDGIFFQLNEWSGIAKYWRTLLREIDQFSPGQDEYRIFLLARGASQSIRNEAYKNIHVLPVAYFDPVCALSDFQELGVICESLGADAFISSYYTLAYGTPNVGMAYDFIPEAMGWMDHHIWKLKEIYMRSLSHCLSISKATSAAASIYYPNLISDNNNIFYPSMAADECLVHGQQAIRSLRIKHNLNYPYAAVIGHRKEYKNVDLLTKALHQRRSDCKPIAMGIVATAGEQLDPAEVELYQRHFQFGLSRLELSKEEMPVFLHAAEALFYPSLLEGFGYPVAEALAQRCPVITTGATSISEILAHSEPGDYQLISGYNPTEALDSLIRLLHRNQRASSRTASSIKTAFCKTDGSEAERFLQRLIELASVAGPPRAPQMEACLSLDGILA